MGEKRVGEERGCPGWGVGPVRGLALPREGEKDLLGLDGVWGQSF